MPPLPPPGLKPLDVDGVSAMVTGTLTWLVATVVCIVRWHWLEAADDEWWLLVCLAGIGLGALGIAYCARRRTHLRRAQAIDQP